VEPPVEADPDDEPVDPMAAVDPDDPVAVPPVDEVPPAREPLPPGPLLDPLAKPVPFPPDPLELPLPPGIDCRFELEAHAAAPNALAAASKRMLRTTVLRMQGISGGEAFGITSRGVGAGRERDVRAGFRARRARAYLRRSSPTARRGTRRTVPRRA
jgi:hypothetical protein